MSVNPQAIQNLATAYNPRNNSYGGTFNVINTGTINIASLSPDSVVVTDSSGDLQSITLNNGQIPIGQTGGQPQSASITGTPYQVVVANGAGSITLSLPQNIDPTSNPSFASLALTNTTNQLLFGTTNTVLINSVAPVASVVYTIPDVGGNDTFAFLAATQTFTNKSLSTGCSWSGNLITGTYGGTGINNGSNTLTFTGTGTLALSSYTFTLSGNCSVNQNLRTTDSPSFDALALTNTTNQIVLNSGTLLTISAPVTAGSWTYTIPDSGSSDTFCLGKNSLTLTNKTMSGSSNTFSNIPTSALTGLITGTNGGTGVNNGSNTLTFTGTGNLALSTYTFTLSGNCSVNQNIRTTDSPTFAAVSLTNTSNQLVLGSGVQLTISAPTPVGAWTYTIPDVGKSDTFCLIGGTQTLTNKTMSTGSVWNGSAIIGMYGGTGVNNGSNTLTFTGTGTLSMSTYTLAMFASAALNQNLRTTDTPVFPSVTHSAASNQIQFQPGGSGNSIYFTCTNPAATRTYTIPDAGANDSFVFLAASQTLTNKTINGSNNTITNISLTSGVTGVLPIANGGTNSSTSLTNNQVMVSSSGSIVELGAMTNGQLVIGHTSAAPVIASLTGTSNQITVTGGAGSITLATPQSIATTSSVQFDSLTLGTTSETHGIILNNNISSYSAATLYYYEEFHNSISFSNAWSQAVTIYVCRIGGANGMVMVSVPTMSTSSSTAAALTCPSGSIPTRFCPSSNKQFICGGTNNAGYAPILVLCQTNGEIYIGPFNGSNGSTPANFTASAAASVDSFTASWVIGA